MTDQQRAAQHSEHRAEESIDESQPDAVHDAFAGATRRARPRSGRRSRSARTRARDAPPAECRSSQRAQRPDPNNAAPRRGRRSSSRSRRARARRRERTRRASTAAITATTMQVKIGHRRLPRGAGREERACAVEVAHVRAISRAIAHYEAVPAFGLELRARGFRLRTRRESADAHAPQRAAARLHRLGIRGGVAGLFQLAGERVRTLVIGERRDLHGEAFRFRWREAAGAATVRRWGETEPPPCVDGALASVFGSSDALHVLLSPSGFAAGFAAGESTRCSASADRFLRWRGVTPSVAGAGAFSVTGGAGGSAVIGAGVGAAGASTLGAAVLGQ